MTSLTVQSATREGPAAMQASYSWLVLAAATPAFAQAGHPDPAALLATAKQEAAAGRLERAIDLATRATAAEPDLADAYLLLGRCHARRGQEAQYDREAAVAAYANALRLGLPETDAQQAEAAMKHLFYGGPPVRYVLPAILGELPGGFVEAAVPVVDPRLPAEERRTMVVCQTTGIKYPDGVDGQIIKLGTPFNRVVSGYALEPTDPQQRMWECVRVHFRSSSLVANGADYAPVARRALSLFLRLYCVGRAYLGGGKLPSPAAPLKVWMFEQQEGQAAERWQEIYLYDLDAERTPLEWIRQICHEYGHFELPPVGPFAQPETWANGTLGELLFTEWLWRNSPDGTLEWGDEPVRLGSFLQEYHARALQSFFSAGPRSAALDDPTAVGFEHFLGMALYAQAVLSPLQLRDLLYAAERPDSEDFLTNLQTCIDKMDPTILRLPGGLLHAGESKPETPFDYLKMAELAPRCAAQQPLVYWVYLPQGEWTVALRVRVPEEYKDPVRYFLTLSWARDPAQKRDLHGTLRPGATVVANQLGPMAAGWYRVSFTHDCTEGCVVESLTLSRLPQE